MVFSADIDHIIQFNVKTFYLQQATMAFNALMSDAFDASADQLKTFRAACHKRYPNAAIFRDIESAAAVTVTVAEAAAPAS